MHNPSERSELQPPSERQVGGGLDQLAFLLQRRSELSLELDQEFRNGNLTRMLAEGQPPLMQYLETSIQLFVLGSLGNPSVKQVGLICHYLETYFEQLLEEPSEPQLLPSEAVSLAVEAAMCSSAWGVLSRGSSRRSSGGRRWARGWGSAGKSEDVVNELLLER